MSKTPHRLVSSDAKLSDKPIEANDVGVTFKGHRVFVEGDKHVAQQLGEWLDYHHHWLKLNRPVDRF